MAARASSDRMMTNRVLMNPSQASVGRKMDWAAIRRKRIRRTAGRPPNFGACPGLSRAPAGALSVWKWRRHRTDARVLLDGGGAGTVSQRPSRLRGGVDETHAADGCLGIFDRARLVHGGVLVADRRERRDRGRGAHARSDAAH